jgi:TetR/AcrR family transcriptional repressor of nem operon
MGRLSNARERLLKAAIDLIWEQGYSGVRVDAVCKRAGVNKGSFYYFFPSKSRLAVEALKHHWETIAPEYDRVFSSDVPPLERLTRYFGWVYKRQRALKARTGRVLGCPFFSVGCEVITQDSQISGIVRALLRRKASYLESVVRDAQAEGVLKQDDPVALARRSSTLRSPDVLSASMGPTRRLVRSG